MSRLKRSNQEEHENHERWVVSYADFMTLLFAFFVVLYATSNQNLEKEKKFENSIRSELRLPLVGAIGGSQSAQVAPGGRLILEPNELLARKRVASEELEDAVMRLLKQKLSEKDRALTIDDVKLDPIGVRIVLQASTFFPVGSAKMRLPAMKTLDRIAAVLIAANRKIIVEGHTDDQPLTGGQFETNWELASARATTVVRYLVKVHSMDPKRMAAVSYADTRPLVKNDNEKSRNKNRRIEIVIVNSEEDSGL